MEINEFAKMNYERSKSNDPFNIFNWEYYIIAIGNEAGELLGTLKKSKRGDNSYIVTNQRIADETVDVITYAFLLLKEMGFDVEETIMKKFEEVNKRLELGGFHKRINDDPQH